MTKKEYQKPVMEVIELQHKSQILAGSVKTTGLDEDLTHSDDEEGGSSWGDAY